MIQSQMISFRPDSRQQRNLTKYIKLIEEVFAMIKQNSSENLCVNSIASSIRQVVLKNDCLESKNDLLDFFFLCQKTISQNSTKNTKKTSKYWIKIIQSKINQVKGFQSLCSKFRKIQIKWGFEGLIAKKTRGIATELQIDVESDSIEVEQVFDELIKDIKLKTLYFFKWCKFIEYGKTIKKIRLKEIDDLRKSLTFNMYAVKFSYFHNWRRQAKFNASNRQKFDQIQRNAEINVFKNTVNSFYSLFEIKKIEQKLVAKVQDSLEICKKQWLFKKISQNKLAERSKSISEIPQFKLNSSRKFQVQKIKFRFLYFLTNVCEVKPIKSKTLYQNFNKSKQKYSLLCAKTALQALKSEFYQSKENVIKIKEMRKNITLEARFNQFKNKKFFEQNFKALFKMVRDTKLKKSLNILKLNTQIKRQLEEKLNFSIDYHLPIESNQSILNECLQTCESIRSYPKNRDLFKYLEFVKLKGNLHQKLQTIKKQISLTKIKRQFLERQQLQEKTFGTSLVRQSVLFKALKKHHQIKIMRANRKKLLKKIYQTNLLKSVFLGMKKYKFIRLSHEQTLQNIEQNIINPKKISIAFERIYERNCKNQACSILQMKINKQIIRTAYRKCFSVHIETLQKTKQMEKRTELKKLDLLFSFLKKNKEYNDSKTEQIRQDVICKLNKVFFIRNLKCNREHAYKQNNILNFIMEQRQLTFINSLQERKYKIEEYCEKYEKVEKMLGLSLLRKKTLEQAQRQQEMSIKSDNFAKCLKQNRYGLFVKQLRIAKNEQNLFEGKFIELSSKILKEKFTEMVDKINYEKSHTKAVIETKANQIYKAINFKSFMEKFEYEAKNSYVKRWTDWRLKENVFEKLQASNCFSKKVSKVQIALNKCKALFGWSVIKYNIEKEKQVIEAKTEDLIQIIGKGRKRQIRLVTQKVKSINQTQQSLQYLVTALKTKYFSKFMRNSLIIKYEKVKEFCAIRSYARNVHLYLMKLKDKSLNGLRIMLMRLRDKENRLKTEQEIIIKVDKAMYNSRKTSQLSETIQRFNSMKRSLKINVPR